jgi:hypothetical protein
LTVALTDRLPSLDRQELLTLRTNARRLQASAGKKADEAAALLPLIDAEIAKRGPTGTVKRAAKRKA